jgi:hypothetical protein
VRQVLAERRRREPVRQVLAERRTGGLATRGPAAQLFDVDARLLGLLAVSARRMLRTGAKTNRVCRS